MTAREWQLVGAGYGMLGVGFYGQYRVRRGTRALRRALWWRDLAHKAGG